MINLIDWGFCSYFETQMKGREDLVKARIIVEHRDRYRAITEFGEVELELSGKLRFEGFFPAVGDWVLARVFEDFGVVEFCCIPKTKLVRQGPDSKGSQVIAANVDKAFIVCSMNQDLNFRRIERYISLVLNAKAQPIILMSKKDLANDSEEIVQKTRERFAGFSVVSVSIMDGSSLCEVKSFLETGMTICLLGSSGVGKSTLINYLIGHDVQEINSIRTNDGKGRHTTTSRQLFQIPGGGMLLDTPGMRELQLWDSLDGVCETFEDIVRLENECKFANCSHVNESGCAILTAFSNGTLNLDRYKNYLKLQREQIFQENKRNKFFKAEQKKKWKKIHQGLRDRNKIFGK